MKDTESSRNYHAEIAANWIKEGTTATILELKRHTQNPNVGYTPFWTWAIRDGRGELADINVRRFCDLLGAVHPYPDTGKDLWEVLRDSGLTVYRNSAVLVVLDKGNPLVSASAASIA